MAVRPVPFVIEGALHSDEVFRGALSASTQEAQGVCLPGHLKVTATSTPSGQVQVAPGAALIKNRQQPGESYYGSTDNQPTLVSVDPMLSGTRYDLIVMRIIDPNFAPWQPSGTPGAPNTSTTVGPYCQIVAIKGVDANTTSADFLGYSAVALARVKMTNTSNVTEIADLRELAQPRTWTRTLGGSPAPGEVTYPPGSMDSGDPANMVTLSNITPQVRIPKWATHADIVGEVVGFRTIGSACNGAVTVRLGPQSGGIYGPHVAYDFPDQVAGELNHGILKVTHAAAPIPTNLRGTDQTLTMRARVDVGSLLIHQYSLVTFQVSFYELVA
ncbi:hypothetical protein [Geodermatophilus sp. DSM 45219]|uniref:hypothetical protein n=1 Tax=Geodermatophilus sp. DSM 45219 TaxID=1881103 RepID=UPI00088734BC|nr:hypothetical protein [Geodermatophilus sp. DSM 45219]SDN78989.1 hypothetical protein SAMN05428965_1634 [Geodermatophilus sp. DSM 45219]